ncbi:hypothetical protein C4D60_Mb09t18880 [Musa balbisiana]|uniref:Uncharacterized protein n=1 Tax=Musa balbisiana TaxID=52838 RepID=A0A4V4H3C6_MUSBA|nr:hypothetical protein C4D60_Mb09t18880 [Musa balbisiana]
MALEGSFFSSALSAAHKEVEFGVSSICTGSSTSSFPGKANGGVKDSTFFGISITDHMKSDMSLSVLGSDKVASYRHWIRPLGYCIIGLQSQKSNLVQ